jgi:hypothetical protein
LRLAFRVREKRVAVLEECAMKNIFMVVFALAALTISASAGTITYTWHQTSSTDPDLIFTAYYTVIEGVDPKNADSFESDPDFGGLVDFYIQGGDYPAITLADLIPACMDSFGCTAGGVTHDWGYPYWRISVPSLFYLDAIALGEDPLHLEYEYWATPTSILIGDDNANKRCWNTELCIATGYWAADIVPTPEPGTLFALLGGLGLLGLMLRRANQRA